MKRLLSSIVVAGLLTTNMLASDMKTETVKSNAVIKVEKKAQTQKLIKEAVNALQETKNAYEFLNNHKNKLAIKNLQLAVQKLNTILSQPNAPYLLPINIQITENEYVGSSKSIAKQISNTKLALEKNNLPLARAILNTLKSEIGIESTNIPLVTYPNALKLAIKYIRENKVREAQDVIVMALNTLVTTDTTIPIPIIKANDLILEAGKISHKNKSQALKYLEEAKKQLHIANLLGYSSKSMTTYRTLKNKINHIESELNNKKNTDTLFEELRTKIEEFKEKAVSVISK